MSDVEQKMKACSINPLKEMLQFGKCFLNPERFKGTIIKAQLM